MPAFVYILLLVLLFFTSGAIITYFFEPTSFSSNKLVNQASIGLSLFFTYQLYKLDSIVFSTTICVVCVTIIVTRYIKAKNS